MFSSIRSKLTITYILLVIIVMVLSSVFFLQMLERYYVNYHYASMTRAANIVATFAPGRLQSGPNAVALSNYASEYATQIGARVLIVDHRQRVLGDSELVDGLVGTILDREEVLAALEGENVRSVQYSQVSEQWILQVAVPIYDSNEQILGVVFTSSSLNHVDSVMSNARRFLLVATMLSILIAAVMGNVLARRITVPIAALTTATEQMSRGDLNQRVSVESKDELGRLADQFNIMAARVQEMTRQLRDFVSNASHEMRTPLTSLNILVKSLREYPLEPAEQEEFLEDIDNELDRLIHLVESLLDLTRLDRLAAEDTMVQTDIVPTIKNTLLMLRTRADEKKIGLEYNLPQEAAPVFAVLHQVKQIVFNLVDNAIKYTPEGGKIHVSLKQDSENLILTVSDTGVGIPPEHRDKVFERFYRVDKARSREQGGTGLGLAIVQEIVTKHGGSIWVEDAAEGQGTTFIVAIPRSDVLGQTDINKN